VGVEEEEDEGITHSTCSSVDLKAAPGRVWTAIYPFWRLAVGLVVRVRLGLGLGLGLGVRRDR
jgi:hypothetical protein